MTWANLNPMNAYHLPAIASLLALPFVSAVSATANAETIVLGTADNQSITLTPSIEAPCSLAFALTPDDMTQQGKLEMRFNGWSTANGSPLVLTLDMDKHVLRSDSLSADWKSVFEDAGDAQRFSFDFSRAPDEVRIFMAGDRLATIPLRYSSPQADLTFTAWKSAGIALSDLHWGQDSSLKQEYDLPDQTINLNAAGWLPLASPWSGYFGIHYSKEDPEDRWGTVRGFGAPAIRPPAPEEERPDATERHGPFDDETVHFDLEDFRRHKAKQNTGGGLDEVLPLLYSYDIDAIYQAPFILSPYPELKMNKNLAYWAMRLAHETDPEASAEHLYWQWGNEVNGLHLDLEGYRKVIKEKKVSPWGFVNRPEKADLYAERVLAPGAEVVQRVSQDVYGDPERIKVVIGSIGNIYNPASRAWLERVMNHKVSGDAAPTLKGKKVAEFVDIICVHYGWAHDGQIEVIQSLYEQYVTSGHAQGIWMTEDHGLKGLGPVTVVDRGLRFLYWVATNHLSSDQARMCWWGIDRPKQGGPAMLAIDLIGSFFGKSALDFYRTQLDGTIVTVLATREEPKRLMIAIVPDKEEVFETGMLELHWDTFKAGAAWSGSLTRYSASSPSLETAITASAKTGKLTIPLMATISEPAIVLLEQTGPLPTSSEQ